MKPRPQRSPRRVSRDKLPTSPRDDSDLVAQGISDAVDGRRQPRGVHEFGVEKKMPQMALQLSRNGTGTRRSRNFLLARSVNAALQKVIMQGRSVDEVITDAAKAADLEIVVLDSINFDGGLETHVNISPSLEDRLKDVAKARGCSMSMLLNAILANYFRTDIANGGEMVRVIDCDVYEVVTSCAKGCYITKDHLVNIALFDFLSDKLTPRVRQRVEAGLQDVTRTKQMLRKTLKQGA